ncbi:hypothetical protein C8F01DRAFT_1368901 [Mycena amicta]|nr:hypothetical protein C8F01DRAFT_1368901 [Mycena amicta]
MNVPCPIQELPAELLAEIFLNVVGPVVRSHRIQVRLELAIPRAAFRLSAVCTYWRQLALNTPHMWFLPTKFYLNALNDSPRDLSMVQEIIKRSSPLPLDIAIHGRTRWNFPKPIFAPLVDLVVSVAHRWREISNINVDIVSPLEAVGAPAFEHLEYVDLILDRIELPPSSLFLHAPHLRHVQLNITDIGRLLMPWTQLTEFIFLREKMRSASLLDIQVVMQCVCLVRLCLNGVAWSKAKIPAAGDIVCLEHLTNLEMHPTTSDESLPFELFFTRFTFPALSSLTISMDDAREDDIYLTDDFVHFLTRSPNLESLTIEHCEIDSAVLERILLAISSSITILNLHSYHNCLTNAFLERLTYNPAESTPPLAPHLQSVDLVSQVGDDYEEDVVREMILSRWWTDDALQALPAPPPVARWSSIVVRSSRYASPYSDNFASMVSRVRAEGLRLRTA